MKIYITSKCPRSWQETGAWTDIEIYKFWKAGNSFAEIAEYMQANPQGIIDFVHTSCVSVLNFYGDDLAIEQFLVYDDASMTEMKLFDLPGMKKKLDIMGPGGVVADTNVEELLTEYLKAKYEIL